MRSRFSLRGEIQGLRAVAVVLVLVFHVWPEAVPGGYVGVDVFFVISGYLIAGSLAREAERTGRISLREFYSRRIRRLLPAASLVLVYVLAGMFLWLPQAHWKDTLVQVAASAIYLENWYLAWSAVNYLASENTASPVQHYWSLSIEEQFYIVWPLMVVGVIWFSRKTGRAIKPLLGIAIALVFASSLAASVLSAFDPDPSTYFVTYTRAWELALGGLMAISLPQLDASKPVRIALCLTGLSAIFASALFYSAKDGPLFPGYAALLPTLGAAMVILAGDIRWAHFRGLNLPPLRYLGDISYSIYLWHWPLIVFWLAQGNEIDFYWGSALIALTIAISHFSHRLVEERFRHLDRPLELQPFPIGVASTVLIVSAAVVAYLSIGKNMPAIAASVTGDIRQYPGPAALLENAYVPAGVPLVPPPSQLLEDRAIVYDSGCHQNQNESDIISCEFGDPNGKVSVAVVGSSHSVNWLPTLDILGKKNGWKITSITKSSCGFINSQSESCNKWHENVYQYISRNRVDVLFTVEFSSGETGQTRGDEGLIVKRWQRIAELNIKILTIRPIPALETSPADCLPNDAQRCVIPRAAAERQNTVAMAAEKVPGVHILDMTDAICAKDTCGPVVGNLIVYRDRHHLTATYARALAPYLEKALVKSFPGLLPIKDTGYELSLFEQRLATISCGSAGKGSKPILRNYMPMIEGKRIVLRRGDWQNELKDFEIWEGRIDGVAVIIGGHYREGGGDIREVHLAGSLQGGSIIIGGKRGPRVCSVVWSIGEEELRDLATILE